MFQGHEYDSGIEGFSSLDFPCSKVQESTGYLPNKMEVHFGFYSGNERQTVGFHLQPPGKVRPICKSHTG